MHLAKPSSNEGIRGNSLNLLQNYLTNRKQFVQVDGSISSRSRRSLTTGLPQGSILFPLLFIFYINYLDLSGAGMVGSLNQLVDDDSLLYESKNVVNIANMQSEIEILCDYFLRNKLGMNLEKTKYIHFYPIQETINQSRKLDLNGLVISNTKTVV